MTESPTFTEAMIAKAELVKVFIRGQHWQELKIWNQTPSEKTVLFARLKKDFRRNTQVTILSKVNFLWEARTSK
jgi:hypothetical protein